MVESVVFPIRPQPVAILLGLLLTFQATAGQTAPHVCQAPPGTILSGGSDGRLLGHLPYPQQKGDRLVLVPRGFGSGGCQWIDRDLYPALEGMIAAARADLGPNYGLMGVSCFRSVERQRAIFCRSGSNTNEVLRAETAAPPGYSEHATGYAIDFGDRRRSDCHVKSCFATTPTGRWLIANAPRFGFEMSFPPGNRQGVTSEPWHWRWVGLPVYVGAGLAQDQFAVARSRFPSPPP